MSRKTVFIVFVLKMFIIESNFFHSSVSCLFTLLVSSTSSMCRLKLGATKSVMCTFVAPICLAYLSKSERKSSTLFGWKLFNFLTSVYLRASNFRKLFKIETKLNDVKFQQFVNSSHANGLGRYSIHGFVILLNENFIYCKSKKQALIAQNSTEADFVAMASSIKELSWMGNIFSEVALKT